jgi:bifunctional DNA-binding transcriptional regulator/antitoxin component of YhaV-PrlF toxin-antitoxin module
MFNTISIDAIFRVHRRGVGMPPGVLSSKYQVVTPPVVRRAFKLSPGQKIDVVIYEGRITLVPGGPLKALRGIARGIDTRVPRDHARA